MSRYDIARLRKENGMSQSELATLLQMNQSFLSAIENGKSPLPVEKVERLCEIFGLNKLDAYIVESRGAGAEGNLSEMTDSDLFNQLLNRFHRQAHSVDTEHHHHDHHEKIKELERRIDLLFERNDALMARNDALCDVNDRLRAEIDTHRAEIDRLRKENYELKSSKS